MAELRTTTGQRLAIAYDPRSNAMMFFESDWFAEPFRTTGVPHRITTVVARRLALVPSTRRTIRRPRAA